VVVLDNLERGHRDAVPPEARRVVADLLDRPARRARQGLRRGPALAALALVGESLSHPARYYRTNVGGTLNLLDAMDASGAQRLVFSSTCAVSGQPDEVPISERAPGLEQIVVDAWAFAQVWPHGYQPEPGGL
jgi:UDP-glucose 4-epimerase